MDRSIIIIDLKSFYASVECVERGLDPMTTDLVVADESRTEKTICLAVSPSLKDKGIRNRCRLFEIPKTMDFIIAPPRMQKYIDYAARIYAIYLEHFSKDDIYVYSIDEAFIDVTDYLKLYKKTPRELALYLMEEISKRIGVRATAGVGTNLYLAKIALDITAKHATDFIGELDVESYKKTLWDHRPITDFWRIGPGIEKRLADHRMFTMRDIASADQEILYKIFGIDAELIIDHAWGIEPVTIADIKKYKPKSSSLNLSQVLPRFYKFDESKLIVREMLREMCQSLLLREQVTGSITIYSESGRGTIGLAEPTANKDKLISASMELMDEKFDKRAYAKKISIVFNKLESKDRIRQQSLFDDGEADQRNYKIESAIAQIKNKYGKNAILMGEDLEESATAAERNMQIGGHRSGK